MRTQNPAPAQIQRAGAGFGWFRIPYLSSAANTSATAVNAAHSNNILYCVTWFIRAVLRFDCGAAYLYGTEREWGGCRGRCK